ncbi:hypothetical protein [Paracoccus marinaquae]|uniref:Uncharacterized protein n=1 Tax=Paracoccus marinaquae TaxID=2841926 RepID=A0ABS6AFS6_9RHOB|nr:hypothetical protein [Paracoccus marinaquae]MBU3028962.1 hypothetical protein [Paracoccus marinaquae]
MAVEITRQDVPAGKLRLAAVPAQEANAARRTLAIVLVLEGAGSQDIGRNLRDGPSDPARPG